MLFPTRQLAGPGSGHPNALLPPIRETVTCHLSQDSDLSPVSPVSLLAQGWTKPEICERFALSEGAVKTHVARIYAKGGIHTHGELLSMIYGE